MKDLTIDETIEALTRHHENDCKGCPLDGECEDVDFDEMAINALKKLKEENELIGKCYRSIADDYLVLAQKMDDEPLVENLLFDVMTEDFDKFCNSADELIKKLRASGMQEVTHENGFAKEGIKQTKMKYDVGISGAICPFCNHVNPMLVDRCVRIDTEHISITYSLPRCCSRCGAKMYSGKNE